MKKRRRMLTVTVTGKKKKMPKAITLFGKRLPVYKSGWKVVQKVELQELKDMGRKKKKQSKKKKKK